MRDLEDTLRMSLSLNYWLYLFFKQLQKRT